MSDETIEDFPNDADPAAVEAILNDDTPFETAPEEQKPEKTKKAKKAKLEDEGKPVTELQAAAPRIVIPRRSRRECQDLIDRALKGSGVPVLGTIAGKTSIEVNIKGTVSKDQLQLLVELLEIPGVMSTVGVTKIEDLVKVTETPSPHPGAGALRTNVKFTRNYVPIS